MKFANTRARTQTIGELAEQIYSDVSDGGSLQSAVIDALIDLAIERYAVRIGAGLRARGLNLGDGEPVTRDTLAAAIGERTGLYLTDFTPDGVATALDEFLSAKLGAMIGMDVSTVLDASALKQSVIDGAVQAVQSGRGNALITDGMIQKIRVAATWSKAGIQSNQRRAWLLRVYQKKYRASHVAKWI